MNAAPEIRPLPYIGEVLEFIIRNFSHISDKTNGKLRKNLSRYKTGELCPPNEAKALLVIHLPNAFQNSETGKILFKFFVTSTSLYADFVTQINFADLPASTARQVLSQHFVPMILKVIPDQTFSQFSIDINEIFGNPNDATKIVWAAYLSKRKSTASELAAELTKKIGIGEKSHYDSIQNWIKGNPMRVGSVIKILELGDPYHDLAFALLCANAYRTYRSDYPAHNVDDITHNPLGYLGDKLSSEFIDNIRNAAFNQGVNNGDIVVSPESLDEQKNYAVFRDYIYGLVNPAIEKSPEMFAEAYNQIKYVESECKNLAQNWELGVIVGLFYVQADQHKRAMAVLSKACDYQIYRNGPAVKSILEYLLVIAAFNKDRSLLRKWRGWARSLGVEIDIRYPEMLFYKKFPPENYYPNVDKNSHFVKLQKAMQVGFLVTSDWQDRAPDLRNPNRKIKGFNSVPSPQMSVFAKTNQPQKVKELLEAGANPNQLCENCGSALLNAMQAKNSEAIELLLPVTEVSVLNTQSRQTKRTCLTVAVENGDPAVVERLLEAGAKVEQRAENNSTPLFVAVGNFIRNLDEKHIPLVINDATLNAHPPFMGSSSPFKETQLAEARSDMASLLEVPEYKKLWDKMIGFHRKNAVSRANAVEIVNLLLANGADPNSKHMHGFTPFLHAAEVGVKDVFFKLLEADGNIREKDAAGQTILLAMKSRGHNDLAEETVGRLKTEDAVWLRQQPDPAGYNPSRSAPPQFY